MTRNPWNRQLPARKLQAGQRGSGGVGTFPRRVYDEGAHRRGHPMPAGGAGGHRGSASRLDRVRGGDGQPADRTTRSGSPRTRPDRVLADKAYSSMAIRTALRARRIKATIGEQGQRDHRASPPGQQGRAATGVRQGRRQDPKRCRTHHQQAPPDQSSRDPLRQAGVRLPRHHRRRLDQDLAP
jgi:hypothetical protein